MLAFRTSDRYDERQKAALAYTDAIIWDPSMADDDLWNELYRQFSIPEIVELGYFVAITLGQQRWISTLDLRHFELEAGRAGVRKDLMDSADT